MGFLFSVVDIRGTCAAFSLCTPNAGSAKSEKAKIQPKDELTDRDLEKVSGGFEITDFSFDIEQTLNIGSQSTGAGPSKVTKK